MIKTLNKVNLEEKYLKLVCLVILVLNERNCGKLTFSKIMVRGGSIL